MEKGAGELGIAQRAQQGYPSRMQVFQQGQRDFHRHGFGIGQLGPVLFAADGLKGPHGEARTGRISAALLREVVADPSACVAFACGPGVTSHDKAEARRTGVAAAPRFLETPLAALREIGLTEEQLEYESYG